MTQVVAARFAVPFYLRLPQTFFVGWEPQTGHCLLVAFRRMGDLSFAGRSSLVSEHELIDSYQAPDGEIPQHGMLMKCDLADGREVPTLSITTGQGGPGFRELRSYSEIVVCFTIESPASSSKDLIVRVQAATNHLIDVYRTATQDPFVRRLDFDLDVFVVAFSFGVVPTELAGQSAAEILKNIHQIKFASDLAAHRFHYRLNTWEDLFPGPVLERPFLQVISGLLPSPIELSLHYELLFTAQSALKQRNYHVAVLEAETAFEVFIARRLRQLAVSAGSSDEGVTKRFENPRDLGPLNARIRELDRLIVAYRTAKGLPTVSRFGGSSTHKAWEENLYRLRNRIVHSGLRAITFDMARNAIGAGKNALRMIEGAIPDFADPVQIATDVSFLQDTAGRLRW